MKIKTILLFLALCVTMGVSAQMRYHDVELNEAKGKVKSITISAEPAFPRTIEFTIDGKQKGVTDAEHDNNGYRLSDKSTDVNGSIVTTKYIWKNGRVVTMTLSDNDPSLAFNFTYNAKGEQVERSMGSDAVKDMFKFQLSDYKYDSRGNWISRKTSGMGTSVTETRTIVYY